MGLGFSTDAVAAEEEPVAAEEAEESVAAMNLALIPTKKK